MFVHSHLISGSNQIIKVVKSTLTKDFSQLRYSSDVFIYLFGNILVNYCYSNMTIHIVSQLCEIVSIGFLPEMSTFLQK